MRQQINTFEELFPTMAPNGVYLCEDLHTSYWREFGGGYRRPGTFIEYSKGFIDNLNAWHSREPTSLAVSPFTRSAHSVHFYDSIVVIERRPIEAPSHHRIGNASVPDYVPPHHAPAQEGWLTSLRRRLSRQQ